MDSFFTQTLIIFLLLLANGVFAMAEIAVVSARKARLSQLADEGNLRAQTALALAEHPNQFLSTIQVGITLVGILAGAFGGATLAQKIGAFLEQFAWLAPYSQSIGFGVVVLAVTYFSLIIGELVPKRLALNNAERTAVLVAAPMQALSKIAAPVVWLLSVSTEAVLRLLRVKPSDEPSVTEEEIKVMIEQGTQIGVFEAVEQEMIEGVLDLDDRRIRLVMRPRPQIFWIDITDPIDEIRQKITESHHSRLPVADDELDNVLGIVYARDILAQSLNGEALDLKALLRPPLFVPESISILKVLQLLKQERAHLALVTDEYGSIEGLVTPDDILERIVGDMPSLESLPEPAAFQRADGSWLVDGMLAIDRFKEIFDIEVLPEEEENIFQTAGGFVTNQMGNIPDVGQHFEWERLRFEVVDMDGRRVDKILVEPLAQEEDADPEAEDVEEA